MDWLNLSYNSFKKKCKNIFVKYTKFTTVGHSSILDKASANGAKGPRFTTRWKQQFINL